MIVHLYEPVHGVLFTLLNPSPFISFSKKVTELSSELTFSRSSDPTNLY